MHNNTQSNTQLNYYSLLQLFTTFYVVNKAAKKKCDFQFSFFKRSRLESSTVGKEIGVKTPSLCQQTQISFHNYLT